MRHRACIHESRIGQKLSLGGRSKNTRRKLAARSAGDIAKANFMLAQSALSRQPSNEDITLETLIEPKLLVTVGQLRQAFLHIGGEFAH